MVAPYEILSAIGADGMGEVSMTPTRPAWYWCLLGAVAMSLGWGLRGSIGGGSLGAMIPGAMIGLVLCLLLDRHSDAGRIAAFAAIGVGFGGQETYGQTVGLSLQPDTFWWAILGFVIKGAVWGLLGGAFIGIALDRQRHTTAQLLAGFAIMILGTWLGWQYLNSPKLIYFSNRFDQPREELWAGLWLGGLLLLAWLRSRVPSLFALYGAIGGGIGFGLGASLQPMGRVVWAGMPLGWWKAMELTFGALLGLAYVLCAWRLRDQLAGAPPRRAAARGSPLPRAFLAAIIAIGVAIVAGQYVPARFDYTIAGTVLASLVLFSESLAWQTAITATVAAFGWDFLDYQTFAPLPLAWTILVATTAVVAVLVARYPRPRVMLLLVTWAAVVSAFRYLLPPSSVGPEVVTMLTVFVVLALILSLMLRVASEPSPVADQADPPTSGAADLSTADCACDSATRRPRTSRLAQVVVAHRDDLEALGSTRRAKRHRVSDLCRQQRPGQRRAPGHAPVAGIELVHANDGDLALVARLVEDGHGRAEVHALVRLARVVHHHGPVETLRQIADTPVDFAELPLPVDVVAILRAIAVARGPCHGRDDRRPLHLPQACELVL